MSALLAAFILAASVLWLTVFGYLLALGAFALGRRRAAPGGAPLPEIAVVVPTLNEAALVGPKLADLMRMDYPREKVRVVVVDGGSSDGTREAVEREMERGGVDELFRLEGAPGKATQINHALSKLDEEIVVVTDVDSTLEASCVRELVSALTSDPATAVVGAAVCPRSALLEERIHWWFLNYLWWLEGEVLSAALFSGVAYAARREAVLPIEPDAEAEDIHVALAVSARGRRVRLCLSARATELRVPQRALDLVRFRRRRGRNYFTELNRLSPPPGAPLGWRLARGVRLWHFVVTPKVGLATALLGLALIATPHWPWALLVVSAFAAPTLPALFASRTLNGDGGPRWRLGLATVKLLALTLLSMLALAGPRRAEGSGEARP